MIDHTQITRDHLVALVASAGDLEKLNRSLWHIAQDIQESREVTREQAALIDAKLRTMQAMINGLRAIFPEVSHRDYNDSTDRRRPPTKIEH